MKSLSACHLLATACVLLSACSKNDQALEQVSAKTKARNTKTSYTDLPARVFAGHKAALLKAEYMCKKGRDRFDGATILYNDRKTKPDAEFVSRDPRRGCRRVITYAIGQNCTRDFGVSRQSVHNAIDRAMETWSRTCCTHIQFQKQANREQIGYVSSLLGFGGNETNKADLQHAGFLPGEFFDVLTPDGGNFILAVTFTFIFFDENGMPTDIDNDGVNDAAFRETYYNDRFNWRISLQNDYDIESVALHEAGHSLGLSHFGKGIQLKNGKIIFTPRAVMNAVYVNALREPTKEDRSFLCSVWYDWNR